jgi:hypothetical protein
MTHLQQQRQAGLCALLVVFLALTATPWHVRAAVSLTYTVDSDAYTPDASINTVCADGLGRCTLRAALDECFALNYTQLDLCTINLNGYHVVIDSTIEVPYALDLYIQCTDSATIDANHAVRAFKLRESSTAVLDSCNVVNGHVCDDDDNDNGGSFILHQHAQLTLQSTNVTYSHACGAGGAIALQGYMSQVNVNGGEVAHSSSGSYAGGIHVLGDAALFVFNGAQIHHNARNGLSATDGFIDVSGVGTTIHSNGDLGDDMASGIYIGTDPGSEYTSLYLGNGTVIRNKGGGIFVDSSWWDSAPYQDNVLVEMSGLVTIEDNSAAWIGGGMLLFMHLGDTFYTYSYATVHYRNNTAFLGGGLFVDAHYGEYWYEGSLRIRDSVFENNVAEAEGGGTFLWMVNGSTVRVDRSLFSNNTAHICGGASIFTPDGAAYSPVSYVSRSTFSNNTALDSAGGALCLYRNDWWWFMPLVNSTLPTYDIHFNTIVYNRAATRGGGIALVPYYDDDDDGGASLGYTLILDSNVVVANRANEFQNTSDIDYRVVGGASNASHGHNFACYVNLLQPLDASDHFTPALCADGLQSLVMPHLQDVGARFHTIMRAHPPTPCSPILNAGSNDETYWYSDDQRKGHPHRTDEYTTDAGAITSSDAHACLACHPLCPTQCVRYAGESTTTCVVDTPGDGDISGSDSVHTLRECIAYCRGVAGISAAQCTIVMPRFFPPQNYTFELHDAEREHPMCRGQVTVSGGNTRIVPYDNRYADFPAPVVNPLTTHGSLRCDNDDDDDGGGVCDDNVACTYDYCADGDDDDDHCVHEPEHSACDDGNEYTQDICHVNRGCMHVWIDNNETAPPRAILIPPPGHPMFHITNGSFTTLVVQDMDIALGLGVCGQNGGAVQVTNFALGLLLRVAIYNNLLPTGTGCPANLQHSRGGGIYVNNAQLQMQQVSCYGNTASYGGCLYVSGQSTVTIRRSTISHNTAAIRGGGGGIRAMDGGSASRVVSSGTLYSRNVHDDLSLGHGVYASQGYNMYTSSGKAVKRIQGLAELDIAKANTTAILCAHMCSHSALCVSTTSPAVNRLKGPFCAAINTDACGIAQIGPFCDIGASEAA